MKRNVTQETGNQQAALWKGSGGIAWVEAQGLLEDLFRPFEDLLVKSVSAKPGDQVLDVGCGTGSTTMALARSLGPDGHCIGIDISDPMIAAAHGRANQESR